MSKIKDLVMDMNEKNSEGKIIYETLGETYEVDICDTSQLI